jgi:hypothetical protein
MDFLCPHDPPATAALSGGRTSLPEKEDREDHEQDQDDKDHQQCRIATRSGCREISRQDGERNGAIGVAGG